MTRHLLGLWSLAFVFGTAADARASAPKILHQTNGSVIVRMSAGQNQLVWQEIGDKKSDTFLYSVDLVTGKKGEIKASKRPFGPSVAGGAVLFGAGRIHEKIDVILHDLATGKSTRLHKLVPWIVEPALQLQTLASGAPVLRAVWERSQDDDGNGLAIYLWEGSPQGKGGFRILADGPVLRKHEIPKEYHRQVRNEYPEIDGASVAFQNNEYGTPNIYRLELTTGAVSRLAPSRFSQERPAIAGPYTVWEESERGFSESFESAVFVHDARTGKVRKINAERGFHYQARLFGHYAIYGAKREPAARTPSIRVHDLDRGIELPVHDCFTGPVYDWTATAQGIYAAQRVGMNSSRLLFATWEQVETGCQ